MKMSSTHRRQAGAALIVALILLVVMTLLGLSSVRTVVQEERMTSNTFDRSLGFQGAEAALRLGEAVAFAQSGTDPDNPKSFNEDFEGAGDFSNLGPDCNEVSPSPCTDDGLCSKPDPFCKPRWLDGGGGVWKPANELNLTSLAKTPEYMVEYLGDNFPCNVDNPTLGATNGCKRYRITARSRGDDDDGRAMVILQSIYATR